MFTDKENTNFKAFKEYYARRRQSFKRYRRDIFDEMVTQPSPPNFEFWVESGPNNWEVVTLIHSDKNWRKEMTITVDPFTRHHEVGDAVMPALEELRTKLKLLDPSLHNAVDSLTSLIEGGVREELKYHLSLSGELIWFRLMVMEGLIVLEAPRRD